MLGGGLYSWTRKAWRRSGSNQRALVTVVLLLTLGSLLTRSSGAFLTLIVVTVVGYVLWRRHNARREREAERRDAEEVRAAFEAGRAAGKAERQQWLTTSFSDGPYTVMVTGFLDPDMPDRATALMSWLPLLRESPEQADALAERVIHIGPQPVAEGVAQSDAVRVKIALEERGAIVKIVEERGHSRSDSRRSPISAFVRREVWNRDGGRCVQCGSQERLEYDHIIALAQGGSNTARNLQLLCETCNRKKGASIG